MRALRFCVRFGSKERKTNPKLKAFLLCLLCSLWTAPSVADTAAAATEMAPAAKPVVRFGMLDIERESTYLNRNDNVQQATAHWLRRKLPQYDFEFRSFTIPQLAEEIRTGHIDVFLSSSGFFVEMRPYGVKDLATLVSNEFPNPNECVGGAIVVRSDRADLKTIESLKGLRGASTNPQNFMAFQLGMSAIAAKGYDPRKFFRDVAFTNNEPRQVLQLLLDGKADVALLRACFLESLTAKEPALKNRFKVIEQKQTNAACQYSTDLYPGWTVAVTDKATPRMAADIAEALLSKPKSLGAGYYWGIATDYRSVNDVFRLLKIGPFEYLNHWTFERFWQAYWQYILIALFAVAGWIVHWLSVERLVKKRTAELRKAMQTQAELHEKALATAAQLEKLTKFGVVNELSAIYAHELAQPLTSIGYLTKTLDNIADRLPPEEKQTSLLKRVVGKIGTDLAKAQGILSRVRQYAKSTIKRNERIDLGALTADVVAKACKIYPKVEFSSELPEGIVVPGDRLELSVMALNLIRNAAESTEDGKVEILLEIRNDQVSYQPPEHLKKNGNGRFAALLVRNAGNPIRLAGLSAPTTLSASDDATTADATTSDMRTEPPLAAASSSKQDGMGMGLLIVQSVLKAHHGKLQYEAKDHMVTFTALLPLEQTA